MSAQEYLQERKALMRHLQESVDLAQALKSKVVMLQEELEVTTKCVRILEDRHADALATISEQQLEHKDSLGQAKKMQHDIQSLTLSIKEDEERETRAARAFVGALDRRERALQNQKLKTFAAGWNGEYEKAQNAQGRK